ncbi:MAG: hypothetical protein FWH20_10820 [Oscillospiraceae bacterium]|nr:hypothetical protein [Oscillospiraceae bacterium]
MLEKILTENDCADCKLCCGFFESEIWEVPVDRGGEPLYDISYNEKGLYICPELSNTGCKLGADKPFDCKIWPFRVMKLGEFTAIALSPLCKKVNNLPLSRLTQFVNEHLADKVNARIAKEPAHLKDYVFGYTILKIL